MLKHDFDHFHWRKNDFMRHSDPKWFEETFKPIFHKISFFAKNLIKLANTPDMQKNDIELVFLQKKMEELLEHYSKRMENSTNSTEVFNQEAKLCSIILMIDDMLTDIFL